MGDQLTGETAAAEPPIRFCINAFTSHGGVEEYAAPDESNPSLRWNVYARTPDGDTPKDVDLSEEGDYDTYPLARRAAESGCRRIGLNTDDIRIY